MDKEKGREAQLIDLAKTAMATGGDVVGRALQGTITGPVVLALLMIGAYGWAPTRMLFEQLSQGVAYGAAQGWKSSIAPALSHIPGIGPFFGSDQQQKPPPAGKGAAPTCTSQWTFLKYSPLYQWSRAWFSDVDHAIASWETYNALDLVGNLVHVEQCTAEDGTVTTTYDVVKYAPGHSDIDNPGNRFFHIL